MRKKLYFSVAIGIFILGIVGCGGMSAPPVSLPTPVTGRITISAPDADGNITVTGEDGSVSASSTVLAENESVTASLMDRFLSAFVSKAYATPSTSDNSCPSVYSGTGYQCATADENGAFTLLIAGSAGDSISIALIDPSTGALLSDPLTRSVPDDIFAFSNPVVDLAVPMGDDYVGYLVVLTQGSDVTDHDLLLYDPSTGSSESVDITFPDSFGAAEFLMMGTNTAITSATGNVAIYGQDVSLVGEAEVAGEITSAFVNDNIFWFGNGEAGVSISIINPISIDDPIDVTFIQSNSSHGSVEAMTDGIYHGSSEGETLALVAAVVSFTSSSDGSISKILGVYDKESMFAGGGNYEPIGSVSLAADSDISDIKMILDGSMLMLTDKTNNKILFYSLAAESVDLKESLFTVALSSQLTSDDYSFLEAPDKIVVVDDSYAFVTAHNGNDERTDTVLIVDISTNFGISHDPIEIGLGPSSIAYDLENDKVYVGCTTSKSVAEIDVTAVLSSD